MTKTVLLTGATGFVGYQLHRKLEEIQANVRVVVREGKQDSLFASTTTEKIITTQDLFPESAEWWADVCSGVDIVIHSAWYAKPGKYLQSSINLECLIGTLNLAKGAVKAGVERFVGIGTCFEYDLSAGLLPVSTPLKPLTPYAAAKAAAYMSLSQYFPIYNVDFLWCRLFYLYGDRESPQRFVPYLRSQLASGKVAKLTKGDQIRDYLDVEEAARIIIEKTFDDVQGAVNICSGIAITLKQLAEKIADEYGRRDLLLFGAREENLIDPICVVGVK